MDKLAAMHSAAACAIQQKITCPHKIFVTSGLPTQNRIQQNFGVGEAHPKIHDPGGEPTGFEDPCRTLMAGHGRYVNPIHATCIDMPCQCLQTAYLHFTRLALSVQNMIGMQPPEIRISRPCPVTFEKLRGTAYPVQIRLPATVRWSKLNKWICQQQ